MPSAQLSDIPPQVARQAVEWLVELQSGDPSDVATRQGLERWLCQHDDHTRAWQHIASVNNQLRSLAPRAAIAHVTLAAPGTAQRREAVKTLALLLFAGGTGWALQDVSPWCAWLADARTAVGEQRTVTLAGGGSLLLNTDSAINLRFGRTERRVQLVLGEVLVTTGKDLALPPRTFVVETAQGLLVPQGTRFAVRQHSGASQVQVLEGAVAIHPHGASDQVRTLRAGEQARFTLTGIGASSPVLDSDSAWADGMLVASGMRLQDFLAELSRYRPGHLGCDPAIADLRISGSYPLADTGRILDTLCSTLPVELQFTSRFWVEVRPVQV